MSHYVGRCPACKSDEAFDVDHVPGGACTECGHSPEAAARAEGRKQGLEEAEMFLLKKADKVGVDAKTIPLGATSGRRTFLGGCPALDVEQFVVSIIVEDANAIRALKEKA